MADVMPVRECKSLEARFNRLRAEMRKEIEEQAETKAREIVQKVLVRMSGCELEGRGIQYSLSEAMKLVEPRNSPPGGLTSEES